MNIYFNQQNSISQTNYIELYMNNNIAKEAYLSFKRQLRSYQEDKEYVISKIRELNNEVFRLISGLQLNKLFISITTSKSIFYRFSEHGSGYEFKFEVFFDYNDQDESDIQATLHIYKNGKKESAYYGAIEYLYNIITKTHEVIEFPKNYIAAIQSIPKTNLFNYGSALSTPFDTQKRA